LSSAFKDNNKGFNLYGNKDQKNTVSNNDHIKKQTIQNINQAENRVSDSQIFESTANVFSNTMHVNNPYSHIDLNNVQKRNDINPSYNYNNSNQTNQFQPSQSQVYGGFSNDYKRNTIQGTQPNNMVNNMQPPHSTNNNNNNQYIRPSTNIVKSGFDEISENDSKLFMPQFQGGSSTNNNKNNMTMSNVNNLKQGLGQFNPQNYYNINNPDQSHLNSTSSNNNVNHFQTHNQPIMNHSISSTLPQPQNSREVEEMNEIKLNKTVFIDHNNNNAGSLNQGFNTEMYSNFNKTNNFNNYGNLNMVNNNMYNTMSNNMKNITSHTGVSQSQMFSQAQKRISEGGLPKKAEDLFKDLY